MYGEELKKKLEYYTDVTANDDVKFCTYFPEESIHSCGLSAENLKKNNNTFVLLIHNTGMKEQSIARVKLPSNDFRAWIWNRTLHVWNYQDVDILEQIHYVPKLTKDKKFSS